MKQLNKESSNLLLHFNYSKSLNFEFILAFDHVQ